MLLINEKMGAEEGRPSRDSAVIISGESGAHIPDYLARHKRIHTRPHHNIKTICQAENTQLLLKLFSLLLDILLLFFQIHYCSV